MFDKAILRELWDYAVLIAPAPIGALIGMRYATDHSPRAQTINWLCSMVMGAIGGAVLGERLQLTRLETALATIVVAAVAMELIAGIKTAAAWWARDPFALLDKVLGLFRRGPP